MSQSVPGQLVPPASGDCAGAGISFTAAYGFGAGHGADDNGVDGVVCHGAGGGCMLTWIARK